MTLPREICLVINDIVEQNRHVLEWEVFGNSKDDMRVVLTWRNVARVVKKKNRKPSLGNWNLQQSSFDRDDVPRRVPVNQKSGLVEENEQDQYSGDGLEKTYEPEFQEVKNEKNNDEWMIKHRGNSEKSSENEPEQPYESESSSTNDAKENVWMSDDAKLNSENEPERSPDAQRKYRKKDETKENGSDQKFDIRKEGSGNDTEQLPEPKRKSINDRKTKENGSDQKFDIRKESSGNGTEQSPEPERKSINDRKTKENGSDQKFDIRKESSGNDTEQSPEPERKSISDRKTKENESDQKSVAQKQIDEKDTGQTPEPELKSIVETKESELRSNEQVFEATGKSIKDGQEEEKTKTEDQKNSKATEEENSRKSAEQIVNSRKEPDEEEPTTICQNTSSSSESSQKSEVSDSKQKVNAGNDSDRSYDEPEHPYEETVPEPKRQSLRDRLKRRQQAKEADKDGIKISKGDKNENAAKVSDGDKNETNTPKGEKTSKVPDGDKRPDAGIAVDENNEASKITFAKVNESVILGIDMENKSATVESMLKENNEGVANDINVNKDGVTKDKLGGAGDEKTSIHQDPLGLEIKETVDSEQFIGKDGSNVESDDVCTKNDDDVTVKINDIIMMSVSEDKDSGKEKDEKHMDFANSSNEAAKKEISSIVDGGNVSKSDEVVNESDVNSKGSAENDQAAKILEELGKENISKSTQMEIEKLVAKTLDEEDKSQKANYKEAEKEDLRQSAEMESQFLGTITEIDENAAKKSEKKSTDDGVSSTVEGRIAEKSDELKNSEESKNEEKKSADITTNKATESQNSTENTEEEKKTKETAEKKAESDSLNIGKSEEGNDSKKLSKTSEIASKKSINEKKNTETVDEAELSKKKKNPFRKLKKDEKLKRQKGKLQLGLSMDMEEDEGEVTGEPIEVAKIKTKEDAEKMLRFQRRKFRMSIDNSSFEFVPDPEIVGEKNPDVLTNGKDESVARDSRNVVHDSSNVARDSSNVARDSSKVARDSSNVARDSSNVEKSDVEKIENAKNKNKDETDLMASRKISFKKERSSKNEDISTMKSEGVKGGKNLSIKSSADKKVIGSNEDLLVESDGLIRIKPNFHKSPVTGWEKCIDCKYNGFCDDLKHKSEYIAILLYDREHDTSSQAEALGCLCNVCQGGAVHNGCVYRELLRLKTVYRMFDKRNLCFCSVCVPFKYRKMCLRQELRLSRQEGIDLYYRLTYHGDDGKEGYHPHIEVPDDDELEELSIDATALKLDDVDISLTEEDKINFLNCIDCSFNGFCDDLRHKKLYAMVLKLDDKEFDELDDRCDCLVCEYGGAAHSGCAMREIRRLKYDVLLFDTRNLCYCRECVPFKYRNSCLRQEMKQLRRRKNLNMYSNM